VTDSGKVLKVNNGIESGFHFLRVALPRSVVAFYFLTVMQSLYFLSSALLPAPEGLISEQAGQAWIGSRRWTGAHTFVPGGRRNGPRVGN